MNHHQVVIVGAGISGCAAAKALIKNGIHDIVVLEATNRIGGRVRTVTIGEEGAILDLGARWLHGQQGNPLYGELQERGLLINKGETLYRDCETADSYQFFTLGGSKVDKSLAKKAFKVSGLLDERIKVHWDPNTEISTFRETHFQEICMNLELTEAEKVICRNILIWMDRMNKKTEAIHEWNRTEHIYGSTFECDNKNFSFAKGVYSIFEHLFLPYVEDKIKLNVEVSSIVWPTEEGDTNVQLHTHNGGMYTANHVLVTSSLGYLKANHKEMFTPHLPAEKVEAIENIWFGNSEKFVFYYEQPFWSEEQKDAIYFGFLMDEVDKATLSKEMSAILGSEALWWNEVTELLFPTNNPNIIYFCLCNEIAKEANKRTDDEVIAVVLTLIRHYSGLHVPSPNKLIRTNWGSDKYFLGSYSSDLTPNHSADLPKKMMEPIYCNGSPAILFAGEAYHHKWMTTLHGAYDTGIQQANVISQCNGNMSTKSIRLSPPKE